MTYLDQAVDMLRLKAVSQLRDGSGGVVLGNLDDLFGEAMAYLSASR